MRHAFAVVLAAAASVSAALAQAPQRLAFDSSRADTASCEGFLVQFVDFRGDQIAGNGFAVRVRNQSLAARSFDPSHLRAQLKSGRTVSFLIADIVAAEYLEGQRSLDADERFRTQLDIQRDPRLRAGTVPASAAEERFLALGWSRPVRGAPQQMLPLSLFCGREPMGSINFLAEAHH